MSTQTQPESYEKFHYGLRPSKQVERKLLVEALHHLVKAGYPIQTYTYLGFGSVYYTDFVLFHKYLYIKDMICVEGSDIPRRMRFNKPFDFIKVRMGRASKIIPHISRNTRYLVWLDYDYMLNGSVLQDVYGFIRKLARGSILIVTVDAEPKLPNRTDDRKYGEAERITRLTSYLQEEISPFYAGAISASDVTSIDLPRLFARVLKDHMTSSAVGRDDVVFHQLFNCTYADGATMLTYGGIVDEVAAGQKLVRAGVYDGFATKGVEPVRISVPPLTVREKLWLDQNPRKRVTSPRFAFEMDAKMVKNYRKFYREYPTYHETLM